MSKFSDNLSAGRVLFEPTQTRKVKIKYKRWDSLTGEPIADFEEETDETMLQHNIDNLTEQLNALQSQIDNFQDKLKEIQKLSQ